MINKFIVETHSEHLILRLQRRIREGRLKHDDLIIVYVEPDACYVEPGKATRIRLDAEGDFIDNWPDGFFTERLGELR